MLKQIDLTNLNHITFIIILIIIFFCIIYLFKVNKQNASIEGFTQYEIKNGDSVVIDSLDNILLGEVTIQTKLNELYADKSEFATNKSSITNQIDNFKKTIESNMSTFKTDINSIMTSNIATIQSRMSTEIITLNGSINALTSTVNISSPQLTIMAYYNTQIPTGWQLCDGRLLVAVNELPVYYKSNSNSTSSEELFTPDLQGRFILGANVNSPNTTLTKRGLRNIGGAETHTLTIDEMPAHNHPITAMMWGPGPGYSGGGNKIGGNGWSSNTGGSKPHNNMPPFYTLNYIIKKPLLGGVTNAIIMNITAPTTA